MHVLRKHGLPRVTSRCVQRRLLSQRNTQADKQQRIVAAELFNRSLAVNHKEEIYANDLSRKSPLTGPPVINTGLAKRAAPGAAIGIKGLPINKKSSNKASLDRYSIQDLIGGGRFGVVKRAIDKTDQSVVAVKIIRKDRHVDVIRAELAVHRLLGKRLADYQGLTIAKSVFEDRTNLYIVMDYIPGGDLFDRIIKDGPFNEEKAISLLRALIPIIKLLHANGITHRDIKPENVLFHRATVVDANGDTVEQEFPVISDFGLCRILGEKDPINPPAGTFGYCAPEVLCRETHYDHSCDIWSLGVLMYAVLAGELPFPASMDGQTTVRSHLDEVLIGPKFDEKEWKNVSSCGMELVEQMLHYNSFSRPSLEVIEHHPWLHQQY